MLVCDNCKAENNKKQVSGFKHIFVKNYKIIIEQKVGVVDTIEYDLCEDCEKILISDCKNWLKTNSLVPRHK